MQMQQQQYPGFAQPQQFGMNGVSPYGGAPGGYGGMQGFAARGQPFQQGFTGAPAVTTAPLTPKITTGNYQQPLSIASQPGMMGTQTIMGTQSLNAKPTYISGGREQVLEQRVRELESLLLQKEKTIQELQGALQSRGRVGSFGKDGNKGASRSPGRSGNSGFRKVNDAKPVIRYSASDQDDPIDVRLEEFYNSTGSAIQFRRINRGFYRFGDSIVELDIINHKLMARTEDGWNRGKFGPVEKFLMYYENIEREKAGILPEN